MGWKQLYDEDPAVFATKERAAAAIRAAGQYLMAALYTMPVDTIGASQARGWVSMRENDVGYGSPIQQCRMLLAGICAEYNYWRTKGEKLPAPQEGWDSDIATIERLSAGMSADTFQAEILAPVKKILQTNFALVKQIASHIICRGRREPDGARVITKGQRGILFSRVIRALQENGTFARWSERSDSRS